MSVSDAAAIPTPARRTADVLNVVFVLVLSAAFFIAGKWLGWQMLCAASLLGFAAAVPIFLSLRKRLPAIAWTIIPLVLAVAVLGLDQLGSWLKVDRFFDWRLNAMALSGVFIVVLLLLSQLPPLLTQRLVAGGLWVGTIATLGALLFIIAFILIRGVPHLSWTFLSESPTNRGEAGGVLPMIIGTAYVTALAVLIAAPIGIATAIYLTEYTREGKLTNVIRFGADCLAGIPSIIFGLFGFVFFVIKLGMGWSVLSGALTLTLMVLPTIIRTSEEAIRAVPKIYREVSYGVGSTRWQMVTRVVLRSALPGIATGIVLSIGRAVSETAALLLTAGSAWDTPRSIFDQATTLSVHFYLIATEGGEKALPNAYASAALLILSILAINMFAYWLMRRFVAKVQ